MKILHVYKDYYPVVGGIENHIRALAEAQARDGHQVTVLVAGHGRETTRSSLGGVAVIRAGRLATLASTPLTLGLGAALRAESPDITHLHFPYPVGEIAHLAAGRGRPYVITYHSDVVRSNQQIILRLYLPVMRYLLRRAGRVLATSPNYVVSSPHLKRIANRCLVVPLGVNPRPFLSAAPSLPRSDLPTLLFLGRHRYYKGLDDLIMAMTEIRARLLVGGDGPMRPQWERLAAQAGLAERILFTGEVSDAALPGLYASADLFVLPANVRAEAFGAVLLEAMASGLACVTTELATGTSYVVQDGVSGLVVPPRNPRALAEAVQRLLTDEPLRRQMGAAGRARVLREFTLTQMAGRIEAVYRLALAERSAGVPALPFPSKRSSIAPHAH